MLDNRVAFEQDYSLILNILEKSVKQTHTFLSGKDLEFYKGIIPENLKQVDLLLWFDDDQAVGFSGTQGQELVMLFLDPTFIGRKYGHEILTWLIDNVGITMIDVNTQNEHAKRFYLSHGFTVSSTDPIDGFGKPYPIDHLVNQNLVRKTNSTSHLNQ